MIKDEDGVYAPFDDPSENGMEINVKVAASTFGKGGNSRFFPESLTEARMKKPWPAIREDREEEIEKFCTTNYGVKFDLLGKVAVKGENAAPLYKHLTSKDTNPKFAGPITWNFAKFVIGRNGEVVGRFDPRLKPDAPEVVKLLEEELAKK